MSSDKTSGRLVGIDVLRGVAVLAVVVAHLAFSMRGLGDAGTTETFPSGYIADFLHFGG